MKVLIVANHNKGHFVPFIVEQVEALRQLGVEFDYFGVHGKGIRGYLSNRSSLVDKIREYQPDLVHAHYGLSGLLANLQRTVPVVTTFHGSDIHEGGRNLLFSKLTIRLSAFDIFVTEQLQRQAGFHGKKQCVIPCGIDTIAIHPMETNATNNIIRFISSIFFCKDTKNYPFTTIFVTNIVPIEKNFVFLHFLTKQ